MFLKLLSSFFTCSAAGWGYQANAGVFNSLSHVVLLLTDIPCFVAQLWLCKRSWPRAYWSNATPERTSRAWWQSSTTTLDSAAPSKRVTGRDLQSPCSQQCRMPLTKIRTYPVENKIYSPHPLIHIRLSLILSVAAKFVNPSMSLEPNVGHCLPFIAPLDLPLWKSRTSWRASQSFPKCPSLAGIPALGMCSERQAVTPIWLITANVTPVRRVKM